MTTGKQGAGQGVRAIYRYDLPTERLIVCPEVAPSVVAEVFMVYRTRDAWEAFDRGGAEVLPWSTDDLIRAGQRLGYEVTREGGRVGVEYRLVMKKQAP